MRKKIRPKKSLMLFMHLPLQLKLMLLFEHFQLSCTIIDYHELSFTLNMFKIFVIVHDDSYYPLNPKSDQHPISPYNINIYIINRKGYEN